MTAQVYAMDNGPERGSLPENLHAEQGVLGAILWDNRTYDLVGDFLRPEHFSAEVNAMLYEACAQQIEAGRRADPTTMAAFFEANVDMEGRSAAEYLQAVVGLAAAPQDMEHYGRAIFDAYLRRQGIAACHETLHDLSSRDIDKTGEQILEAMEARLQEIAEGSIGSTDVPSEDLVGEFEARLRERQEAGGGLLGISTGLADIDRLTSGLIAPQVIVLAGRPSMGKTTLATNIASRVCGAGHSVLIYSLEMARQELTQRIIGERAGIPAERLQRAQDLDEHDMAAIRKASAEVRAMPLFIDDASRLTPQTMLTRARRRQRRQGLSLIIIDHIGYVRGPQRRDNRTLELGDIMKSLRAMAKALHVPVMVLCQLNRANQQRDDKRPQLSDLRQSGEIEEDADQVWLVHRDFYYLKRQEPGRKVGQSDEAYNIAHTEWLESCSGIEHQADVIIAKNRNGPADSAKLYFDEALMRFDNLQREGLFSG